MQSFRGLRGDVVTETETWRWELRSGRDASTHRLSLMRYAGVWHEVHIFLEGTPRHLLDTLALCKRYGELEAVPANVLALLKAVVNTVRVTPTKAELRHLAATWDMVNGQ
jgi:hypothetical protein